jgi:tetratricopeptide (TPR) repeat protein
LGVSGSLSAACYTPCINFPPLSIALTSQPGHYEWYYRRELFHRSECHCHQQYSHRSANRKHLVVIPNLAFPDIYIFPQVINNTCGGTTTTTKSRELVPVLQKPNSSSRFTGRGDILAKLSDYFIPRPDFKRQPRRIFVLHGMGGIGKTQICLKFSEDMSDRLVHVLSLFRHGSQPSFRFSHIFWVDASSADTISQCLKGICSLPAAQSSGLVNVSSESALAWMGSLQNEFLMVLDNADSLTAEELEKFFPLSNGVNILITTRNPALSCLTVVENSLGVNDMTEEDAVSLLLRSSALDMTDTSLRNIAKRIVSDLCCLPLAVDQAGAFIRLGAYDLTEYHTLYKKQSQKLLSSSMFKGASLYNKTVFGTWELSMNQLKFKARSNELEVHAAQIAILILNIFAFYHYQRISEDIFKNAAENSNQRDIEAEKRHGLPLAIVLLDHRLLPLDGMGEWDSFGFKQGIQILLTLSLIMRGSSVGVYSVHPLVHAWMREIMSDKDKVTYCKMAYIILACSISDNKETADYAFRQELIPHLKANSQYNTQTHDFYDDSYERISMILDEGGDYAEAERLKVEVVEERKKTLGDEHLHTISAMDSLASTYRQRGKYKEGEELGNKVLIARRRLLGEDHSDTICTMGNLALIYCRRGQYKEAEEIGSQVFNANVRILGEQHPDTLMAMGNLASTLHEWGHYIEAQELELKVLDMRKRILGEYHPHTINTMGSLATTYSRRGKYKEAEELEVQVHTIKRRLLGEEHPQTIAAMGNHAVTCCCRGKYEEAEELQSQALNLNGRILGEEHPYTISAMSNLASIYHQRGKYKQEEELQIKVLDARERILGEDHPETIHTMGNLAATYSERGKYKEAVELGIHTVDAGSRILGVENPHTILAMGQLALIYYQIGNYSEAQDLGIKVLDAKMRILGEDHPETIMAVEHLSATYLRMGQNEEAERAEVQVLGARRKILGEEHPDTILAMGNLALIYLQAGHYKRAERLITEVLDEMERNLGEEHPHTTWAMEGLAASHCSRKKYKKAEELYTKVLNTRRKNCGEEHPQTIRSITALAYNFNAQHREARAIDLMIRGVELSRKFLGTMHPETIKHQETLNEWTNPTISQITLKAISKVTSKIGCILGKKGGWLEFAPAVCPPSFLSTSLHISLLSSNCSAI